MHRDQWTPLLGLSGADWGADVALPREKVRKVLIFSDVAQIGSVEESARTQAARLRVEGEIVEVLMPMCTALGFAGTVRWYDVWL